MQLSVDLHSHSSYAGGVGKISLSDIARTMLLKGIDVYGIGDCLYPPWQKDYQSQLTESPEGFLLLSNPPAKFIRQTEVIFCTSLPGYKHRIMAHHLILFPDRIAVEKMMLWMKKKGSKNTIARPFILTRDSAEMEDALFEIQAIDDMIEIIPAHILTPDGILGHKNNLGGWKEFYGEFTSRIHAAETGLSADPEMLSRIPDLQDVSFVSFSDAHSAALNRIGREFTILEMTEQSYNGIVNAIRNGKIKLTAEFVPAEGRYYLTGHRADRHRDNSQIYFTEKTPQDLKCPLCQKKMHLGVRDRVGQLIAKKLPGNNQPFIHLIPLIEIIAYALGRKSVQSRQIREEYDKCIKLFKSEIQLWQTAPDIVQELLDNKMSKEIIKHIIAVRDGRFDYNPPGFDGQYGVLRINSGV